MAAQEQNKSITKIALLAGGGLLPKLCAEGTSHNLMAVTFTGQPQPEGFPVGVPTQKVPLGAIGKTLSILKKENVSHVLLVGHLEKTSLFNLKPDLRGLQFLAKHALWHDDALLTSLTELLENEGFGVLSVKDILPKLLAPKGTLSTVKPSKKDISDITLGLNMLNAMSALDVGQSIIIKHGVVLGIEAIEGTQNLIQRCASLRGEGNTGGILIKAAKAQQTDKADIPTVGAKTMQLLTEHNYAGLALKANQTLLLEQDEMVKIANTHNIFIHGVD